MKRKLLALLLSIMTIISVGTITTIPAQASTTVVQGQSGSSLFKKDWEYTSKLYANSGKTYVGKMVFGYDTMWINEDYCWTMGESVSSTASVFRDGYDTSYKSGTKKDKQKYSKIEKQHKTYYVRYRIELGGDYSSLQYTTTSSSVK